MEIMERREEAELLDEVLAEPVHVLWSHTIHTSSIITCEQQRPEDRSYMSSVFLNFNVELW